MIRWRPHARAHAHARHRHGSQTVKPISWRRASCWVHRTPREERTRSLPLAPDMTEAEQDDVLTALGRILRFYRAW